MKIHGIYKRTPELKIIICSRFLPMPTCPQFSLVNYAAHPDSTHTSQLAAIKRHCPHSALDPFWTCLTPVLASVESGHQWSGRHCCTLGISTRCRHACATAAADDEVAQTCRHSDEPSLFACLGRQTEADSCCGRARTDSCKRHCQTVFEQRGSVTPEQRQQLVQVCLATNGSTLAQSGLGCLQNVMNQQSGESFWERKFSTLFCLDTSN